MGASLISVMATSTGAAAAYVREGFTNLRIGLFLETSAALGAFIGALLIAWVSVNFLTILFSLVLFFSAYLTIRRRKVKESERTTSHPWAKTLKLPGNYPVKGELKSYTVQNVPLAWGLMGIAGVFSGLLGIGSGSLKVLAMDQALRIPYKVATATSNFMIGITAAVSASIYFSHGYIQPLIAFPVMIGVLMGSFAGARLMSVLHSDLLRIIFSIVICLLGAEMLLKTLWEALR